MELIFVRHALGQHVMNLPESLHLADPALTTVGERQAKRLLSTFPLDVNDVLVISPLRRTLQTAAHWTSGLACKRIVHPLVGPRMFPETTHRKGHKCDQALGRETIVKEFPGFELADVPRGIWENGINSMSKREFSDLANQFIMWCKSFNQDRIYIVSHDGTITAYRKYLGELVTRDDFLGDTGWHQAVVQ